MRTLALALLTLGALVLGALLGRSEPVLGFVLALALAAAVALAIQARASARADRAGANPRVVAMVLFTLGLARGASAVAPGSLEVPDRGLSAVPSDVSPGVRLRELEVVGASEPGPRCEVALRHPPDPGVPRPHPIQPTQPIIVSAPPQACPLAAGERVAVLAQALDREPWRRALYGGDPRFDLGRGPAVWRRPSPDDPSGLSRITRRYWRAVAAVRQRAWSGTRGDPAGGLVAAVGLGLRSALPPDQRERLRAAGLGHLIAVSGLHVAVASVGLQAALRRVLALVGGDPRWACVIAWLPLWAYVGLTGAAASAVRAAVMLTGVDLATVYGRPSHGPTLLASTAAAMLVVEPRWLFDPGFALSIAAMAAIVTAGPGDGPRLGPLAMSWRITWVTAPISVVVFDVAPIHGLVANAVALPLFAALMPASLLALLAPAPIAGPAWALARILAQPILDLAGLLARVPGVGPAGLLGLATAALLGHRWVRSRVRSRPPAGRKDAPTIRPGAPAWLPPRLACALALVVGLGSLGRDLVERRGDRATSPAFDWVALGSTHARSLVVADPSTTGRACLVDPRGSAHTWAPLLELLGVHELTAADAPVDPATAELLAALARGGVEVIAGPRGCQRPDRRPDPAEVRAALRACRARQGGRGRALVRAHAGAIDCRIADRWVRVPELTRGSERQVAGERAPL